MTGGPVNIYEYEALAHERLPKPEYDFIAGGATDEITLKRTRAVFDAIMLRPRMLVDISQRDLSTTVLGKRIAFPIMVGTRPEDYKVFVAFDRGVRISLGVVTLGSPARLRRCLDALLAHAPVPRE